LIDEIASWMTASAWEIQGIIIIRWSNAVARLVGNFTSLLNYKTEVGAHEIVHIGFHSHSGLILQIWWVFLWFYFFENQSAGDEIWQW
jgi:hypothetical protein